MTTLRTSIFAAAMLLVPTGALAADYCITFPGFAYKLVGRNFTKPLKGQCKAWIGFSPSVGGTAASSGTGCLSSDGSKLAFTIKTTIGIYIFTDTVSLDEQGTGTGNELLEFGQSMIASTSAVQGAPCKASDNPIPD